ncbi:phosphonate C-P lyase system protein PhnG [Agrobacterium sp. MA01]|uniref:phosphonate C-P lyase system protein PhnG n=1 Tax=Agrobacterium sp. MA01 TaxID=2664893 RepID=UPI00129AE370|nr:phosphonate C-P lyase system protein PhnG [Agrobacterium sp. MA01]QGG91075.1 phosphonate C-P lyase system protein PhnG [Agrobacterium sp. MA01]
MTTQFQHAGAPGDAHARRLETLARANTAALKAFAEELLAPLGAIDVIQSRTGLAMLPMRDTVKGTDFHLGEVLVAEAHIRLRSNGTEGYGMIVGRDLERAMAMAIVDAAGSIETLAARISDFVEDEALKIMGADTERLRAVEATRVDMETF